MILASASPRRLDILRSLGIEPEVHPVAIQELPEPGESPAATVERLAREKAACACNGLASSPRARIILGADTAVVVDEAMFGKPADAEDAIRMLSRLAGRPHDVMTGIALLDERSRQIESGVCRTVVHFVPLARDRIVQYVGSGEAMDKAGAYAIQSVGGSFVDRIEGSYTNVVGLPVELMIELLGRFALSLAEISAR